MTLKEYHKVDLETGIVIDTCLFDDEIDIIPDDVKLGWGGDKGFHNPKWDLVANEWVESLSFAEILAPKIQHKINELSDQCNAAIENGYDYNGDFFQFNMKDQSNFNQQLSLLLLDPTITEVLWKTENNGVKMFTREVFIQACKYGETHKRNNIGHYWQLKQYIYTHAFESHEELEAIDYSFVVPPTV